MNKVGVINYGSGNFNSLCNALNFIKVNWFEISQKRDFENTTHIILPGVGSYKDCINRLSDLNLLDTLRGEIKDKEKFFLGICVGHQILSTIGMEFEESKGLDIIPGKTIKIEYQQGMPVPHVGWAEVIQKKKSLLFQGIADRSTFYFLHSYYIKLDNQNDLSSTVIYGNEITASVENRNIFGVQFHPEKSQSNGLKLLRNFTEISSVER